MAEERDSASIRKCPTENGFEPYAIQRQIYPTFNQELLGLVARSHMVWPIAQIVEAQIHARLVLSNVFSPQFRLFADKLFHQRDTIRIIRNNNFIIWIIMGTVSA